MNNKMSGDLKKIQVTGKYFVEIWKAIGMESIDDKVASSAKVPLSPLDKALQVPHGCECDVQPVSRLEFTQTKAPLHAGAVPERQ